MASTWRFLQRRKLDYNVNIELTAQVDRMATCEERLVGLLRDLARKNWRRTPAIPLSYTCASRRRRTAWFWDRRRKPWMRRLASRWRGRPVRLRDGLREGLACIEGEGSDGRGATLPWASALPSAWEPSLMALRRPPMGSNSRSPLEGPCVLEGRPDSMCVGPTNRKRGRLGVSNRTGLPGTAAVSSYRDEYMSESTARGHEDQESGRCRAPPNTRCCASP